MHYRALGKTGISVSEIGMGSEGYVDATPRQVKALVDQAFAEGINFFDLYNPNPDVRTNLGLALEGRREQVIIQGHLCTVWQDGQYKRSRDLQEVGVAFYDMLTRLKTDYIDIGMIHYVDSAADFEKVFEGPLISYVLELKKKGVIRHIGLSSHNPIIARKAIETGWIDVLLFSINPAYDMQPGDEDLEKIWADESYVNPLCNIDPERDALYKACGAYGVGISVMKAFGGGDLLDEKMSPFGVAMTPAQCVHYALTRPGAVSVLGGFRTPEQVQIACRYSDMAEEEKDYAQVLTHLPKHTFRGKCMYCGHCAPCTVGIDVASVNKYHDLCEAQGMIPETVREHYMALEHHASECIACGLCMENCPFEVDIVAQMIKAKELFGE